MQPLTVPGNLDALKPVRDYTAKIAKAAGLSDPVVYKLCLAVDEIATNVVMHGYEEAGISGDIEVSAGVFDNSFQVQLKDHGQPYDPASHEQPADTDLGLPLEDRRMGGLGILLAKDSV